MSIEKQELPTKILISLGIIHQLNNAWLAKALTPLGLNQSQFNLLNHFAHQPQRQQTISQLAQVMQMNQPGITKVVNKLVEMKMIEITKDEQDGRKKWIKINANGLEKVENAHASFTPKLNSCFQQWEEPEMQQMLQHLDKFKHWLDNNRD